MMDNFKKILVDFEDGSQNYIFEINFGRYISMSVAVRFTCINNIVYDFWNDVVHQPKTFIPYGYMENGICKKFYSYYSNKINVLDMSAIRTTVNEIKNDAWFQSGYTLHPNNYVFLHLKEPTMFPILKLVIPGLSILDNDIMKNIRSEINFYV